MKDREWDIFMMEVEQRNEELIQEFLLSKMRPRDLQAMVDQLNETEVQQQQPQELEPDAV